MHGWQTAMQVFVLHLKAELENVARLKLKAQSYCISVSDQGVTGNEPLHCV